MSITEDMVVDAENTMRKTGSIRDSVSRVVYSTSLRTGTARIEAFSGDTAAPYAPCRAA
jgi:hypothetical protein